MLQALDGIPEELSGFLDNVDIVVEEGLDLLPVETLFQEQKSQTQVRAIHRETGAEVRGYEIHMGRTHGETKAVFRVVDRLGKEVEDLDGAADDNNQVWGSYIHGIFDGGVFRRNFLNILRSRHGWEPLPASEDADVDPEIDRLADQVGSNLDLELLDKIVKRTK